MTIKWYGHSTFLITTADGTRILTDPCDASTGYNLSGIHCDIITSSHAHFDHNFFDAAAGDPVIITTEGMHEACGVRITGIPTWHDEVQGAKRGPNVVFRMEVDGMTVVHMGDIGHELDTATMAAIGQPDVLMLPVGGVFTIDAAGAVDMMHALKAHVTVPMHYMTPALKFEVDGVDKFMGLVTDRPVRVLKDCECMVNGDVLSEDQVIVFDYAK